MQFQVPQNIDMEDPPSPLLQRGLHPLLAVRASAGRDSLAKNVWSKGGCYSVSSASKH